MGELIWRLVVCGVALLVWFWVIVVISWMASLAKSRQKAIPWHERNDAVRLTYADGTQLILTGDRKQMHINWDDIVAVDEE